MSRNTAPGRRLQPYTFVALAAAVASQLLAYCVTKAALPHLTAHLLGGPLDARIPCVPAWVTVYWLSYPFWAVYGLWILSDRREHAYRMVSAFVLSMFLTAAVFLLYPCTMVRPELTGDDVFTRLLLAVYRIDAPVNLCPSVHVLVTYLCCRGAFGSRRIPPFFRAFSLIFLLLVCCSVLLVKQHVLVDIPAAVAVGELAMQTVRLLRLERIPFAIEKTIRKE